MKYTMRTKIFVDSSFWIALVDKSDSSYQKAKKLLKKKEISQAILVTSDHILDECLTRIKRKVGAKFSFLFYKLILDGENQKILKILQTTKRIFKEAYRIFENNPLPKSFSFTDATTIALMKAHKIEALVTFDQDFKKIKPKIQVLP